ncbi:NucA/NucB deoxyribonuclease domain-containing protein [Kitasatospora herbaricolor]|uniref:NucA/NucB deoxyribonuclease domain-containing protein n=1 Tax=Kitasatospora herbaricolor TaxID=68217 RepID=UPI0036DC9F09
MPHLRRAVAGFAAAMAVVAGLATAPAQASPVLTTAVPASGTVQSLNAPLGIPDTCAETRRQLRTLAAQGHAFAACTTPAVRPPTQSAAQAQAAAASITVPSWCTTGWRGTRTEMCEIGYATLSWYNTSTGVLTGTADFTITQDIQPYYLSRTFAENFELQVTSVTGTLPGATLNLAVTCGGTCSATSYFPNGSAIVQGSDITTSIAYSDSTTTVNKTYSLYTLSWGVGTTTPITWGSPYYRCDDLISGYSAGCVVPDVKPVLTTMATLPNIAANIGAIQQAGPHHYGRQADGLPLTRNSSLETANRNVACPSSRPTPPGMSCDEYPFAKTDQGASQTTAPDWGWAWVPVTEQSSQGGRISAFFGQNRVLDGTSGTGDAFWVAV